MTLKLEVGKSYKMRNGKKTGAIEYSNEQFHHSGCEFCYHSDGTNTCFPLQDIISEWHDEPEYKLLKDWNPQEGDVFKDKVGYKLIATSKTHAILGLCEPQPFQWFIEKYTLVSRANQTPRTFGELSDAEKGALLLAELEGERIQWLVSGEWMDCEAIAWGLKCVYRIAPTRIKGSIEIGTDGKPMFDTWEAEE